MSNPTTATYQLLDITEEWLAEYNRRAGEANEIYAAIESGELTEMLFWADPSNHQKIVDAMEMQVALGSYSNNFPTFVKKADPLIENVDFIIETRDGAFGVWAVNEANWDDDFTRPVLGPECSTKLPEPHLAGEFPMSCYQCHMVADS